MKKNKKGFSLLELMLVLAIVAALAVSAFFLFSKVEDNRKTDKQMQDIVGIKNDVVSLYAGQSSYPISLTEVFRSISKNYNSNKFTTNIWGGSISLMGGYTLTRAGQSVNIGFVIKLDGIPQQACVRLASHIWSNFTKVTINDTVVYDQTNVGTNTSYNLSLTTTACQNTNSISLVYIDGSFS